MPEVDTVAEQVSSKFVDVLIVGAGLSGIGCARHLQMDCPERSFALLESRDTLGGTRITCCGTCVCQSPYCRGHCFDCINNMVVSESRCGGNREHVLVGHSMALSNAARAYLCLSLHVTSVIAIAFSHRMQLSKTRRSIPARRALKCIILPVDSYARGCRRKPALRPPHAARVGPRPCISWPGRRTSVRWSAGCCIVRPL